MRILIFLLLTTTICQGFPNYQQSTIDSVLVNDHTDSAKVKQLLVLAWNYKYSDTQRSTRAVGEAINISTGTGDPLLMGDAYYYKSMIHYLSTELDSAQQYSDRAIGYYLEGDNVYGVASIYNLKGLVDEKLANYEQAIAHYLKSKEYADQTENLYAQSNPLHNIGLIYERTKDYSKALEYVEKALEIRMNIGDSAFIAASYQSLSSLNNYLGKDSLVVKYGELATDIYTHIGDVYNLMVTYNNLGLHYLGRGELSKSQALLDQSLEMADENSYPEHYMLASINMVALKNKKGQFKEAKSLGEHALEIAKGNGLRQMEQLMLIELVDTYFELGVLSDIYSSHNRIMHLSDSLLNEENLNQIANMETLYRVKEKESKMLSNSY